MKVLVLGSGGREHALAWKCAQGTGVEKVYVAPGNAGTATENGLENIALSIDDIQGQIEFAKTKNVDLTIVGPEGPLVNGVVDQFKEAGLACFGPDKVSAQLEGSKTYAKEFLQRHGIPTASYQSFTNADSAIAYLETIGVPCVIKADGLAAGKGVIIAQSIEQAKESILEMLSENRFGGAGHRVVIEEFLVGEEASFICIVDGLNVLNMASSQDHKAAHDGDTGPNTGGMGAYSPAPVVDADMHQKILDSVIYPTVCGMEKDGNPYTGFLYAGLMIGKDGIPKVLEFNCRFGDPETQPIMMRLQSDLVEHCLAAVNGNLHTQEAKWDKRPALGVVMASEGYPGAYRSGDVIAGLDVPFSNDSKVFHAGTEINDKTIKTSGGRVLCVTALGNTISNARDQAYKMVDQINWNGAWYRSDIGHRAVNR